MAQGEAPDPQAVETFGQSKLQWDLINRPPHQIMLNYYKALIRLRKTNPVLKVSDREHIQVTVNKAQNTLILKRWNAGQELLCLLNFSDEPQSIVLNQLSSRLQKIFDSAAVEWNGPTDGPESIDPDSDIRLQPQSVIIYTQAHV